jgi:hypothetical protein
MMHRPRNEIKHIHPWFLPSHRIVATKTRMVEVKWIILIMMIMMMIISQPIMPCLSFSLSFPSHHGLKRTTVSTHYDCPHENNKNTMIHRRCPNYRRHPSLAGATVSTVDAMEQLDQSQQNDIIHLLSTVPSITKRNDLSWADNVDQSSCIGYDAPGSHGNIAWMSSLYVPNTVSSFTIYNGPLTYIPHILSRCNVIDDHIIELTLDYIPRSYGAYDQRDEHGNYPGPEQIGRVAFEYSGNRMEYETKFGSTSTVMSNIPSYIQEFEHVIQPQPQYQQQRSDVEKLVYGPSFWNIQMKCTDKNIRILQEIRTQMIKDYIIWSTSSSYDHRPGAPVNAQYVYDTKLKQNSYLATYQYYQTRYRNNHDDDFARKLATAECGPLDEAYVGGGS